MTKKTTTLGIFLAVVMLCGSVPIGFSEPLRVQLEQGIETEKIKCDNPSHVLVERTNGKLACVTERVAERMSWEIVGITSFVDESNSLDYDADATTEINSMMLTANSDNNPNPLENIDNIPELEQMGYEGTELEANNEKQILQNNNQKLYFESGPTSDDGQTSHSSYGYSFKPAFTVEMPTEITVGETAYINYTVNWNDENGDPFYDEDELEYYEDYILRVTVHLPDEIKVMSNNFELLRAWATPNPYGGGHMLGDYHGDEIPYDDTSILEGTIEIKLLEPMFYEHDDISIGFNRAGMGGFYLQTVSTDDGIILVKSTDPRSDKMKYHMGFEDRYTAIFSFNTEEQQWRTFSSDPIGTKDNGFPDYVYTPKPIGQSAPPLESNYIPREGWDHFAKFLRIVENSGQAEVTKEWLMSYDGGSMSEEFVNDFFEVYPEFLITDTDFRFFSIPEAQAATPQNFFAYGYYKVDSDDRYYQGGDRVTICAYDANAEGYDEEILKNGRSDVCKKITSSNGFFSLNGINYDPHDNSFMDLKFGIKMKNDIVEIQKINLLSDQPNEPLFSSFTAFESSEDTRHNESRTSFSVGDVVGENKNHVIHYFYLDTITKAHDNLYSKTNYDTPFVTLVNIPNYNRDYDTEYLHGGSGHDFIENTITYPLLSSNVDVNLQYSAILAHEYGHHVQHRVYQDKHNSAIPPCDIEHSFNKFLTTSCGWSEGWAWFLASWLLDDSTLTVQGLQNTPSIIDLENTNIDNVSFLRSNSFDGSKNEGWVAAALYDIIDPRGENGNDDINRQESKLWNAFVRDDAQTIFEFESDWNDLRYPSLDNIFALNTISEGSSSCTPETSSGFVFYDHFTCDLSKWTQSGGNQRWAVKVPDEEQIPRTSSDNTVANAANCDTDCNLTMTDSIDLSGYNKSTLQFWRYLDKSLDGDEGLRLEISTDDTSWTELDKWTKRTGHANDRWMQESVNLSGYLSNDVKIRFVALASSSSEEIEIDDVTITGSRSSGGGGGGGTNPPPSTQTPPTLNSISNVSVNEGATKTVTARATDTNGDTIRYSLSSSPSWVSINSNSGIITISAPSELSNSSYSVTVRATDNDGSDTETFTINITEVNQKPSLSLISNINSEANQLISFTVTASDSDIPTQSLSFSISGNPSGAVMDSTTGLFSWTPNDSQAGTHTISFTVTDNGSPAYSDSQDVTFTVTEIPDTTPPSITIPADKTYEATNINTILDDSQIGTATATDDTDSDPPTITHDTPNSFPIGSTTVTYTATDDSGNVSTATQTITIQDTTPPSITAPADIAASEGTDITLGVPTVNDIFPVTITNNSPDSFPVGTTTVTYTAIDSNGNKSTDTQTITVTDTTIPTTPVPFVKDGTYFINQPIVFDCPGGDHTILYKPNDVSRGAIFLHLEDTTNPLVVTPTEAADLYVYVCTTTDDSGEENNDESYFSVEPDTDELTLSPISDVTINEGDVNTVTVSATAQATFSLINPTPPFVTIAGNTITISPDYYHADTYQITVKATSGDYSSDVSFDVTVNDSRPTGYLSATVDNNHSTLEVTEGESFIVKFQYSEALSENGWVCFSLTDPDGNEVGNSMNDIILWDDRSQYSFDGVNWGGHEYSDRVFHDTCKSVTGDQLWLDIPTIIDSNTAEGDEIYHLNIVDDVNYPKFEPRQIPLTIKESGLEAIKATVDSSQSTLTVTEGESFIVKFQYDKTLPRVVWSSFILIDPDGNEINSNDDIKLWADRNQYSFDGVNWGGDGYYDEVFYGNHKYLIGDSIWVEIQTKTDGITEGDEIYRLKVDGNDNVVFPLVDLRIQDQ